MQFALMPPHTRHATVTVVPVLYTSPPTWRSTRFVGNSWSNGLQKIARVFQDAFSPRNATCPTVDILVFKALAVSVSTIFRTPITTQKGFESLYDTWLSLQVSHQHVQSLAHQPLSVVAFVCPSTYCQTSCTQGPGSPTMIFCASVGHRRSPTRSHRYPCATAQ